MNILCTDRYGLRPLLKVKILHSGGSSGINLGILGLLLQVLNELQTKQNL